MTRCMPRGLQKKPHLKGLALVLSLMFLPITSCSDDDGDDASGGSAGARGGGAGRGGIGGAAGAPSAGEAGEAGSYSVGVVGGAAGAGGTGEGGDAGFDGDVGGFGGFGGSEVGGSGGEDAFAPSGFAPPVVVDLDPSGNGEPSSLFWSEAGDYLLIADNRGNRIWKWEEGQGISLYATTTGLPADPSPPGTGSRDDVGQLVELANGTVVVTRFGFQTHGNVLWVTPGTDDKGELLGIDPKRRRISLLLTASQQLYSGYFTGPGDARVAAVTKLEWEPSDERGAGGAGGAPSGSAESDYAPGFKKPVGLLEYGGSILAVDQESNVIYKLPKSATPIAPPYLVFAQIEAPDQLAAGPDGSVFTGQFRAASGPLAIRQISPKGEVVVFDSALTRPSGIAYDAEGKRLFAADNNGTNVRQIRIYELE